MPKLSLRSLESLLKAPNPIPAMELEFARIFRPRNDGDLIQLPPARKEFNGACPKGHSVRIRTTLEDLKTGPTVYCKDCKSIVAPIWNLEPEKVVATEYLRMEKIIDPNRGGE